MKKIPIIVLICMITLASIAYGEYKVETADDEYVSDTVFFTPNSSWKDVSAKIINLKEGRLIFYTGRDNAPKKIEAEVMPLNATNKRLSFKSEDISIASVNEQGIVTPTGKAGNTVIDISCGKAKAKMKINVVRAVEGVTMSQSAMTLYADKPVTAQLEALIYPENATIHDVKWESEDKSVAFVDNDGLVYPNGVGTTNIVATTLDGGFRTKCAVTVTTWEKRKESIPADYTEYRISVEEMVKKQMSANPTTFINTVLPANESEVKLYSDPENLTSGFDKYQFLNLGISNNIDSDTLDAYLYGKGVLSGMGKTFNKAADSNDISEVYLVIHACLESGNGTSKLARGVEVNGTTVYNLFGIGAIDADPVGAGSKYAYEHGWTTLEKAVEGGAEWISDNYINNIKFKQDTLYKMRWNPESPANHQYATDIEWATKQARNMGAMFEAFPTAEYRFDIPVFAGQERIRLE